MMQCDDTDDCGAPPPPARSAGVGSSNGASETTALEALQRQLSKLILQKEEDRLEIEHLHDLVKVYQRHTDSIPLLIEPPAASRCQLRVASAGHRRCHDDRQPNSGNKVSAADELIIASMQLGRLGAKNDAMVEATVALELQCQTLAAAYDAQLDAYRSKLQSMSAQMAAVDEERAALKARVADDILLKSQRNRIEMAARRIAAPKLSRSAGLLRQEAVERNAMAAHDDLYYVRNDLARRVPIHQVTLVLQTFDGVDQLRALSPTLVPFLLGVYHATLEAQAAKRNGYQVVVWEAFSCYVFQTPMAALAFAAACDMELLHFDWPDTIVHCLPFRRVAAPSPPSDDQEKRAAGRKLGSAPPLVFCGPRLHTYLHFCTPCSEMSPSTGRLQFFGHEVSLAISTLVYLVRPGEICANAEWGNAVVAQAAPTASPVAVHSPATVVSFPSSSDFGQRCDHNSDGRPNSASVSKDLENMVAVLGQQHYVCDPRTSLPKICVVLATDPVKRGAYAQAPPPLPQYLDVPQLLSILPQGLEQRRQQLQADATSSSACLATTDAQMALVLLANRCLNGRACGPDSVTTEMRAWIARAVQASIAQAAELPATVHQAPLGREENPSSGALLAHGASHNALGKSHRRSVLSEAGGGGLRNRTSSNAHDSDGGRGRANSSQRRASSKSSLHAAAAAASAEHHTAGGGNVQQQQQAPPSTAKSSAVVSAAPSAPSNVLVIPFPPLLDVAPAGSTSAMTKGASRAFYKAHVFQKLAHAYESNAMSREDAFLAAHARPLTCSAPPVAYVTTDVANVRSFDGCNEVALIRFFTALAKLIRRAATTHHAFLIATNEEDVYLFAFRDIGDAIAFTATMHSRFREETFLDYLALPPEALHRHSPNSVHIRCGVSYGIPRTVGTLLPAVHDVAQTVVCAGAVVQRSGYLCAAALPGETLVTHRAIKMFWEKKKHVTSLEYTIQHRGLRLFQGGGSCATSIYSIMPSSLASLSRQHNAPSKPNRSFSQTQRTPSIAAVPVGAQSPGGNPLQPPLPPATAPQASSPATANPAPTSWFNSVQSSMCVGGVTFDAAAVSSAVFSSPTTAPNNSAAAGTAHVDFLVSIDLDKIARVVDTPQRELRALLRTHPAHQRHVRQVAAVQSRQQQAERILMSSFDPLVTQQQGLPPSPSLGPLAVMYADVEGSMKLFEAAPEGFVRSQQHFNCIVKDMVVQYEGYVVRTNGFEAWIVVFPTIKNALEAAVGLQQALLAVGDWPSDIVKHERALRVRDAKTGALLFNGLRARVGVASGILTQQPIGARIDYVGQAIQDAVRIGKSAPGGDIWMTVETCQALEDACVGNDIVVSCSCTRLLHQLSTRTIPSGNQGEAVAIGCVLRSVAGRVSKFPAAIMDRYQRIASQLEKDLGCWWKQPVSVGMRNEAIRLQLSKKKSVIATGFGQSGAADGSTRSPSTAAATLPVVGMLLERLQRLEQVLPASVANSPSSTAQHAPTKDAKGQFAPAAVQKHHGHTPSASVAQLATVVRGAISLLRGNSDVVGTLKVIDDACIAMGVVPPGEATPPTVTLKPVAPSPKKRVGSVRPQR